MHLGYPGLIIAKGARKIGLGFGGVMVVSIGHQLKCPKTFSQHFSSMMVILIRC